jgi:hypothetical protein
VAMKRSEAAVSASYQSTRTDCGERTFRDATNRASLAV